MKNTSIMRSYSIKYYDELFCATSSSSSSDSYDVLIRVEKNDHKIIIEHTMNYYEKKIVLPRIEKAIKEMYPNFDMRSY